MTRFSRGDILLVRWPDLGRRTATHVAVVVHPNNGTSPLVCAVGTSDEYPGRVYYAVNWSRGEPYRWVRGWPQGDTTPTRFYWINVQEVPRHAVERKCGSMPNERVDTLLDVIAP